MVDEVGCGEGTVVAIKTDSYTYSHAVVVPCSLATWVHVY